MSSGSLGAGFVCVTTVRNGTMALSCPCAAAVCCVGLKTSLTACNTLATHTLAVLHVVPPLYCRHENQLLLKALVPRNVINRVRGSTEFVHGMHSAQIDNGGLDAVIYVLVQGMRRRHVSWIMGC